MPALIIFQASKFLAWLSIWWLGRNGLMVLIVYSQITKGNWRGVNISECWGRCAIEILRSEWTVSPSSWEASLRTSTPAILCSKYWSRRQISGHFSQRPPTTAISTECTWAASEQRIARRCEILLDGVWMRRRLTPTDFFEYNIIYTSCSIIAY